ncbi:MAG: replicative DNA helicase [Candidatus Eutrophobiaceae bacterium]
MVDARHGQEPPAAEVSKKENDATVSLRMLPHSPEAERALLGGLLIKADALIDLGEAILETDFYKESHQLIFRAIQALSNEGAAVDVVTVAEWLENRQLLDKVGQVAYLAHLAEETPVVANINAYAEIIRKRAILRTLLKRLNEIGERVFNPKGQEYREILDFAEQSIFEIAERSQRAKQQCQKIDAVLSVAANRIQELYDKKNSITGLETGFGDLDHRTAGLQQSDLIIIAGRPSMGKTAFAVNIAEYVAVKSQKGVAIFSMEMPAEQLAIRMLASLGHVNQQSLRTGQLSDPDWSRIASAISLLNNTSLFIDDTPSLSPAELRGRCRRLVRQHPLDLVIVDYLQLMHVPSIRNDNRVAEISHISRSLKAMAKELNVPVIALSQLSRAPESRPNRRPVMSDLRESGAIEQDADLILFLYRDEVGNADSKKKGEAELIIGKQRNGPIGTIKLAFDGKYVRFGEYINETAAEHPLGGYRGGIDPDLDG